MMDLLGYFKPFIIALKVEICFKALEKKSLWTVFWDTLYDDSYLGNVADADDDHADDEHAGDDKHGEEFSLMMKLDSGKSRADLWQFAANVALEVASMILKLNDDECDLELESIIV